MFILLEGCDGAGKSKLAEQLTQALPGAVSCHHGSYPGVSENELAGKYMASFKSALAGNTVILDRCWLSEPIYAEVYRKAPPRISPPYIRMLERAALQAEGVVVLCQPPEHEALKAFTSGREEMLDNVGQWRRVYQLYGNGETIDSTNLPVVVYDWTDPDQNVASLLMRIGQAIHNWRTTKKILIVGDQPNSRTHQQDMMSVPFVSFNGGGCSRWLAEQLDSAKISESSLAWINAYRSDGTPMPHSIAKREDAKIVIALGSRASEWLVNGSTSHRFVPHPQRHKRFDYAKPYPLIREIMNVYKDGL